MSFLKPLGILLIVLFLLWMLFLRGNKNQQFLFFCFFTFPFMHINLGAGISLFEIITILFFIIFYKRRSTHHPEIIGYGYLLAILTLIILIGLIFSPIDMDNSSIKNTRRLFPIFIYGKILIEEGLHDDGFVTKLLKAMVWLLAGALLFMAIQMVIGLNFRLVNTLNPNVLISKGIRYPGYFSDPQQFSQFLGALSFICLIVWKEKENTVWHFLLAAAAVIGILATGGRAGLMGWALGLFIYLMFSKPKNKMIILFLGLILTLVAFFFQEKLSIFNRGTDLNDTFDFRAQIWEDAFEIFLTYPFFGIGIGNYASYVFLHYPDQLLLINNELVSFDQPESGYLLFLTELGGFGFICIMLFAIIPICKSFFFYFKSKNIMHIQMISAICCWLIGFYSTYSLGDVRLMILIGTIISLMITLRIKENNSLYFSESNLAT
jgi:O-antigen ligase